MVQSIVACHGGRVSSEYHPDRPTEDTHRKTFARKWTRLTLQLTLLDMVRIWGTPDCHGKKIAYQPHVNTPITTNIYDFQDSTI